MPRPSLWFCVTLITFFFVLVVSGCDVEGGGTDEPGGVGGSGGESGVGGVGGSGGAAGAGGVGGSGGTAGARGTAGAGGTGGTAGSDKFHPPEFVSPDVHGLSLTQGQLDCRLCHGQDLTGGDRANGDVKLLTSCPACQQGLAKFADDTGLKTDYIVVELAKRLLGDGWQERFLQKARDGGIERVLL